MSGHYGGSHGDGSSSGGGGGGGGDGTLGGGYGGGVVRGDGLASGASVGQSPSGIGGPGRGGYGNGGSRGRESRGRDGGRDDKRGNGNEGGAGGGKARKGGRDKGPVSKNVKYQYPTTCYNCGDEHPLYLCNRAPDEFGFIPGCQRCGKGNHWYDICPRTDVKPEDELWYHIVVRNGLPPFRQSKDMRATPGFYTTRSRPMPPAFAAYQRSLGYFAQFNGEAISRSQRYIEDLSWRNEEELLKNSPMGSMMHPGVVSWLAVNDLKVAEKDQVDEVREADRTWTNRQPIPHQAPAHIGVREELLAEAPSRYQLVPSEVGSGVDNQGKSEMVEPDAEQVVEEYTERQAVSGNSDDIGHFSRAGPVHVVGGIPTGPRGHRPQSKTASASRGGTSTLGSVGRKEQRSRSPSIQDRRTRERSPLRDARAAASGAYRLDAPVPTRPKKMGYKHYKYPRDTDNLDRRGGG